jgi:hypothetical protein
MALTKKDVDNALSELSTICEGEYRVSLAKLFDDADQAMVAKKLKRITGIALKRKFVEPGPPNPVGETHALHSWKWQGSPEDKRDQAPDEFALLCELRKAGQWNVRPPAPGASELTWKQFQDDVESERGLFKVLVLYLENTLNKGPKKTIREYLDAPETKLDQATFDLADLVLTSMLVEPAAQALGVLPVVAGIVLVGVRYGYDVLSTELGGDVWN